MMRGSKYFFVEKAVELGHPAGDEVRFYNDCCGTILTPLKFVNDENVFQAAYLLNQFWIKIKKVKSEYCVIEKEK